MYLSIDLSIYLPTHLQIFYLISKKISLDMCPFLGGKIFAVNGPSLLGTQKLKVYEVDYTSGELLGAFSPKNEVHSSNDCSSFLYHVLRTDARVNQ